MKRIEAYIRNNRLEAVKEALESAGVDGLTTDPVRGFGRQRGQTDMYRGSTYALNLVPKTRIVVIVKDDELESALDAIVQAARQEEFGDGKIFVSEVLDAVRIRTGERGDAALS